MSLHRVRATIINALWQSYLAATPVAKTLFTALKAHHHPLPPLDHFAVIDLPSDHTGIPTLRAIFERLGFVYKGAGYLPEKQNAFAWLCEEEADNKPAGDVLSQVVVADFNLAALPANVVDIIKRYSQEAKPFPFAVMDAYLEKIQQGDQEAEALLVQLILRYFAGRVWSLPTYHEVECVRAVNELLAWVLVFGRCPNHFTFAMHLSHGFTDFNQFLDWVEHTVAIPLNYQAGRIKGDKSCGIQQASTHLPAQAVMVADGKVPLAAPFVEFVWRYPLLTNHAPHLFSDYFSDFVAEHANNVVESLYDKERTIT